MSVRPVPRLGPVPSARVPTGNSALLLTTLVVTAIAVGALSSSQPFVAVAVVLGLGIVVLVAANVQLLPLFLVFTMFVESVALGPGFRIGRLAAVMALAVVMYYLLDRGSAGLKPNALLLAIVAYGMWMLASVYWSSDSGLVFNTFFRYLLAFAYMLTFAVLVRSRQQLLAIFATLAFGALVFGILSFAGYAETAATSDTVRLSESAKGLQGDHNFFAVYQVVALPAALVVAAVERRRPLALLYYAVVGVIVLSVVASLSRTGLLTLGVVVLATLVLPARFFFRRVAEKAWDAFWIAAAALLVGAVGASPFVERALTIFQEQGPSGLRGSGRVDLWRAAAHGFRDHPWLGLGAGNFRAKSFELLQTTPGVDIVQQGEGLTGRFVHNMYLGNLTELGVIGFTLFLAVLLLTARYLFLAFRRAGRRGDRLLERTAAALLVTLVGFLLAGIFLSSELSKPLWIIIGLALALDVMTNRLPQPGAANRPRAPG
jgi:O-antigen ligase